MGINNAVYDDWGKNKNTLLYFHYWTGNEDEAQAYNDKYGVKMPTITWDMGGTGENLKLGVSMTKQTTNSVWQGGTHYIITPDHEILNIGEAKNLRSYLEDSLKVPKGDTVDLNSYSGYSQSTVKVMYDNTLHFQAFEGGYYSYVICNMKGQILLESMSLLLSNGDLVDIKCNNIAPQPVILKITTPSGILSKALLLNE